MTFFDNLLNGDKSYYDYPISVQRQFLCNMGIATNDFDRSFKQFKGQLFFMTMRKYLALSLMSFFALLFLLPYYLFRGLFQRNGIPVQAVCRATESELFIPQSLINKYQINHKIWNTKGAIFLKDVDFILHILCRYSFYPYFLVKVIYKIAKYSIFIHKYHVSAIIVNDEFSFTSSIMTYFCGKYNVKHINIQHGEKGFLIRDSYFRFHKCYIWDEHYQKLFCSLYAEPSQFIIELPKSMKFDMKDYFSSKAYADFKYYLGLYNENEIISIVKSMSFARHQGFTVKYRPHPNYSNIDLLKKYVTESEIEYPSVNILKSISSTKNVVGVSSTVLVQAYFNGQNVIIDDISFEKQYNLLHDLDYILIDKVKNRLSTYQI